MNTPLTQAAIQHLTDGMVTNDGETVYEVVDASLSFQLETQLSQTRTKLTELKALLKEGAQILKYECKTHRHPDHGSSFCKCEACQWLRRTEDITKELL